MITISLTRGRTSVILMAAVTSLAFAAHPASAAVTGGNSDPAAGLTKLNIGIVPALDDEPIYYAQSAGYYKQAGLDVNLSTNDAGAASITAVVNGTHDAAVAAWFPAAIGISKGAKLKFVQALSHVDKNGGHAATGLMVKPDSPIKGYKDLEGKTVAVNALTSVIALSIRVAMKNADADPTKVRFTALPFKSALQAVSLGQVDAADVSNPFPTIGVNNGLKDLGDPYTETMPKNGPTLVLITSDKTWAQKADALKRFRSATFKAARELNANDALAREVARKFFGLNAAVAKNAPIPAFTTGPIDTTALQKELDIADEYGYFGRPLKAKDLLVSQ